jgi:hypothetical protein
MYLGDPIAVRLLVNSALDSAASTRSLDTPKSSTLMSGRPSGRFERKRFAGFRSRWTMP